MANILLMPPIAFLLILAASFLISFALSFLAPHNKVRTSEPYSCGEEFDEHMIQPDYSQFFPYAFFFTILHVVAMMVATVPKVDMEIFVVAIIYIGIAIGSLLALLRS